MEKLIELLTEHCRKHYWFKDNDDIEIDSDSVCFHLYHKWKRYFPIRIETVICKDFGFIKWLVDNDKIDRDKIIEKSDFMPIVSNKVWDFFQPTEEQELLMLLSISDTPIEDLISYLR